MKRNIIFDIDGTLWDSAKAVTDSWNEILAQHEETKNLSITTDDMYRYMGHTMQEISEMMMPFIQEGLRAQIMDECMAHENAYLETHSGDFYPQLVPTLKQLSTDYNLYIVSNCQDGYIQVCMADGEFEDLIKDFECYGRTQLKKGDNIVLLMKRNQIEPNNTVYIGDTQMDEEAARFAGLGFFHAAYGFGTATSPDGVLNTFTDIPQAINNYFSNKN